MFLNFFNFSTSAERLRRDPLKPNFVKFCQKLSPGKSDVVNSFKNDIPLLSHHGQKGLVFFVTVHRL